MNWAKLDAALAAAVGEVGEVGDAADRHLAVLIDVDPAAPDSAERALARPGISLQAARGEPVTASLTPGEVADLSDQPWVRRISLARALRLHGGRQEPR